MSDPAELYWYINIPVYTKFIMESWIFISILCFTAASIEPAQETELDSETPIQAAYTSGEIDSEASNYPN